VNADTIREDFNVSDTQWKSDWFESNQINDVLIPKFGTTSNISYEQIDKWKIKPSINIYTKTK